MSLPVIITNVLSGVRSVGGRALLIGRKYSPEICIGLGIAGFGGTVAATVHATNETSEILDERERKLDLCEINLRDQTNTDGTAEYTRADYEQDVRKIRAGTRRRLIRTWLPVGTLGAGSVISVLGGYRILNGRYVATAAAYKTLEAGYDRYRENVIAKFGKATDEELMSLKAEEIEKDRQRKQEAAQEGPKPRKKKSGWEKCGQMMIFDEYSDRWQRYWTPDMVFDYLRTRERYANDLKRIRGHFFLNELNDMLGFARTSEGQVLGWVNEDVDFGLDRIPEEKLREILACSRNEDIRIPLDIHPEGIIFDMIDNKKQ